MHGRDAKSGRRSPPFALLASKIPDSSAFLQCEICRPSQQASKEALGASSPSTITQQWTPVIGWLRSSPQGGGAPCVHHPSSRSSTPAWIPRWAAEARRPPDAGHGKLAEPRRWTGNRPRPRDGKATGPGLVDKWRCEVPRAAFHAAGTLHSPAGVLTGPRQRPPSSKMAPA